MKKLIYIAVFTVSSLGFVSCTADSVSKEETQQISATEVPGPGDDHIIIKPPK